MITTDKPGLRVEEQDWSTLTLEAFPAQTAESTSRSVYTLNEAKRTDLLWETNGHGGVSLTVSAAEDGSRRAWVFRSHLLPGQKLVSATLDGVELRAPVHLEPREEVGPAFPFGGQGSRPMPKAGPVAEIYIPAGAATRTLHMRIQPE